MKIAVANEELVNGTTELANAVKDNTLGTIFAEGVLTTIAVLFVAFVILSFLVVLFPKWFRDPGDTYHY